MEPVISLKEHIDEIRERDRSEFIDFRDETRNSFKTVNEKMDQMIANQTSLRVEHVKTGFIATAVVALAEIGRYLGRQ